MNKTDSATTFNLPTEFDDENGLMIHTINNRVKVVASLNERVITIFVDMEKKNSIDSTAYTLGDYFRFLVNIAKEAEKL